MDRPDESFPCVLFLVRSFNRGGAERQLVALAIGLHARGWPISVACFYAGGPFQAELERAGVSVIDLRKRGRWDIAGFGVRLLRMLRKANADIVHGYLPVPNMLALLTRAVCRRTRIVWGVRASNVDLDRYDWLSRLMFRASCCLARYADLTISNSCAGRDYHVTRRFPSGRILVIPNGIDVDRFQFDPLGRERVRREWGIESDQVLVGLVGRLDPMKDHPTFIRAAALLAAREARWRFVCVGEGPAGYAASLRAMAEQVGLGDRLLWAGARDDMPAVYSALDIATSSSSYGEGFPNVIAEAMACGRLCVVTDVGDSAAIVADTGFVVAPRAPDALAEGVERAFAMSRRDGVAVSNRCRDRIVSEYGIDRLLDRSEACLRTLARGRSPTVPAQ